MRPLIWGGEHTVVVAPLEGEPRVGDILMFAQASAATAAEELRPVVHRVVKVKEAPQGGQIYITRGDNCIKTERVRPDEIIGRVVEVHRTVGYRPWHILPFRQFAVASRSHRLYTRVWMAAWPARRLYYLLRFRTQRLRYRLSSIIRHAL